MKALIVGIIVLIGLMGISNAFAWSSGGCSSSFPSPIYDSSTKVLYTITQGPVTISGAESQLVAFDVNTKQKIHEFTKNDGGLDFTFDNKTKTIFVSKDGKLHKFDSNSGSLLEIINSTGSPRNISINSETGIIYTSSGKGVGIIDTKTNKKIGHIDLRVKTNFIQTNEKKNLVYVSAYELFQPSDEAKGTFFIIQGETRGIVKQISLDGKPKKFDFNPNTNIIYLIKDNFSTLTKIDALKGKKLGEIPLDFEPVDIKIDAKKNLIYVLGCSDSRVISINGTDEKIVFEKKLKQPWDVFRPTSLAIDHEEDIIFLISYFYGFIATIGGEKLPEQDNFLYQWQKVSIKSWSIGELDTQLFSSVIWNIIENNSISIPETLQKSGNSTIVIPDWFKKSGIWLNQGKITDKEYLNGLEFLISREVIRI